MNRWHLQSDRVVRKRSARPGVEALEGRTLLSTAQTAKATVAASELGRDQLRPNNPPYDIVVGVSPVSDPGGTGNVFQQGVEVYGNAPAYATIWLAQGLHPGYFTNVTKAGEDGNFDFVVPVGYGSTVLQVFAETTADTYSNVEDRTVTRGNAIVAWDSVALKAISNLSVPPAEAARDLAILHAAQYDAVAAIDFPSHAYQVHVNAPKGASAEAAADAAADQVLDALFPSQVSVFSGAYEAAIGGLPLDQSVKDGSILGAKVATLTLADRANDGSNVAVNYPPSNAPGLWRPTPPSYAPAVDPQFAQVMPFVIPSTSAFRPPAPPAVGSLAYDQALDQVASLGRVNSTTRTPAQTGNAEFWSGGPGTVTDPGHWNEIAEAVSVSRKDSLDKDARLFSQLDFALADTGIASSDSQYTYDEWRPITAVQQTDPTFTPLLATPASPSFVSDSAAYGAAASTVLTAAFGSNVQFTDNLYVQQGVTRSFPSFAAAATVNARSQVWAGDNFSFDVQAGVTLGNQVGNSVLARFPKK